MEYKKNRQLQIMIFLIIACVSAFIIIACLLINNTQADEKEQQFVPPAFEDNAISGEPQVDEALGWSELALKEGYKVKVCGVLNADADKTLPIWFYSEPENTVWVKLRIYDMDGNCLGVTGLLKPGEYVESVQLNDNAASGNIKMHVMGYEPDTYYSEGAVDFETQLYTSEK